jgi:hypothetical protein
MCLMCVTFPVLLAVLLGLVIAFDFAALMIPAGFFVFARYSILTSRKFFCLTISIADRLLLSIKQIESPDENFCLKAYYLVMFMSKWFFKIFVLALKE